jgi:acyl-CoA thioester hydrolase
MRISLDLYKFKTKYQVHWGDMDAANHVNNLVYLKWAESARIEYFTKLGANLSFEPGNVGPILGWQECKYLLPVTFPDTVKVGARTIEIMKDRIIMETAIFSKKYNKIAAIAKHAIIPYDYSTLQKVTIPEVWLKGIKKIDKIS